MGPEARQTLLLSRPERRQMLRDGVSLLWSAQLAGVWGGLTSLLLRVAVEPGRIGIWTAIRVLLEYGGYSSGGINRAAALDIAVAAGRGDQQSKRHMANVAMTIEVVTGLAVGLILVGAGLFQSWRAFGYGSVPGESRTEATCWAVSFWLAAAIAVLGRYHAFSLTMLRSQKKFSATARARVVGAVADLVCLGGGAWLFGYYGLVGGAVIVQFFNVWYVRSVGGLRFALATDRTLATQLLHTGWPMAAAALALAALRSVDRLVILSYLPSGVEQLGWYSAALLLGRWAYEQSNLLANVVYPRLGETLGRTNDPEAVLRIGLRAAELLALGLVPCAGLLLLVGEPALRWILPKYRPGMEAAGGLIAASVLLGITIPLRYALFAIGRTIPAFLGTALAALTALVVCLVVLHTGGGLAHVAWASAAASGTCLALLAALCLAGHTQLWPMAARVAGISLYLVAGIASLRAGESFTLWAWLFALIWCSLPTWRLARQIDWQNLLKAPTP